jgi:hypothetical protein
MLANSLCLDVNTIFFYLIVSKIFWLAAAFRSFLSLSFLLGSRRLHCRPSDKGYIPRIRLLSRYHELSQVPKGNPLCWDIIPVLCRPVSTHKQRPFNHPHRHQHCCFVHCDQLLPFPRGPRSLFGGEHQHEQSEPALDARRAQPMGSADQACWPTHP